MLYTADINSRFTPRIDGKSEDGGSYCFANINCSLLTIENPQYHKNLIIISSPNPQIVGLWHCLPHIDTLYIYICIYTYIYTNRVFQHCIILSHFLIQPRCGNIPPLKYDITNLVPSSNAHIDAKMRRSFSYGNRWFSICKR